MIDPMKIDSIRILQGQGPVSVNASLSKVTVSGFSRTKVVENKYFYRFYTIELGKLFFLNELRLMSIFFFFAFFRVSSKDFSWETTIKLPKMRLEGNYHMRGRILVIPLNGRGKCFFEPSEF